MFITSPKLVKILKTARKLNYWSHVSNATRRRQHLNQTMFATPSERDKNNLNILIYHFIFIYHFDSLLKDRIVTYSGKQNGF